MCAVLNLSKQLCNNSAKQTLHAILKNSENQIIVCVCAELYILAKRCAIILPDLWIRPSSATHVDSQLAFLTKCDPNVPLEKSQLER